jgi:hypothetical protein
MCHAAPSGRGSGIVVSENARCAFISGCAPGPAVEVIGCVAVRERWGAGSRTFVSALRSAGE